MEHTKALKSALVGPGPIPRSRRLVALFVLAALLLVGGPFARASAQLGAIDARLGWGWPTGTPVAVVRAFDPPAMPWLAGHRGVDLDAPIRSRVMSPTAGTVIFAGTVVDRPVLSIMHAGGLRTTYEPVSALVSVGDRVSLGTPIGIVEPGHSPGSLHWGARFEKNEYIDPLRLLVGPSVLKPWD